MIRGRGARRAVGIAFGAAAVGATSSDLSSPRTTQGGGGFIDSCMDLGVGVPRFARAMATSGMIAADYKLLGRIADWKGIKEDSQEYKDRESAVHKRTAKRILGLALSHGGIWIKLCQYVSTLKPMIPEEYTNTLGEAQDSATTRPYEAIAEVIQREFGARPEDLFAYFERSPVAAASIAQVHRAITKDGERVAVKVQYPSLPREIGADIASLRAITWLWGVFYPDYEVSWLIPEFEESLLAELDFRQEAVTSERAGRMMIQEADSFARHVHVPAVRWDLTSERVMCMEWIDGIKPTRTDDVKRMGIEPLQVAKIACAAFADMVFVHGIVHTDPHPGNVLVRYAPKRGLRARPTHQGMWSDAGPGVGELAQRPNEAAAGGEAAAPSAPEGFLRGDEWQLVILDHGMYRRLNPSFRQANCALWEALLLRDEKLGMRAAVQLGLQGDAYNALSLMLTYRLGKRGSRKELQSTVKRLSNSTKEEQQEFVKQLPRDFYFVGRNMNLVRGLNVALGGTTQSRISASGDAAVRGIALNDNVWGVRELLAIAAAASGKDVTRPDWWWQLYRDIGVGDPVAARVGETMPTHQFCRLNEPTDSEIAAWVRTASGQAALEEAVRAAEGVDPELAQQAITLDSRRARTPESNMVTLSGASAVVFGGSAASAAGYVAPVAGKDGQQSPVAASAAAKDTDASAPSAALVALAVAAAADAKDRAASGGSMSQVYRQWGAWFSVQRIRWLIRALDFQMWLAQWWLSVMTGAKAEENWGEFGGPGESRGGRRRRWGSRRSGKDKKDAEADAEAETDDEDGADWADTVPADAPEDEKRMHVQHLRQMDKQTMG